MSLRSWSALCGTLLRSLRDRCCWRLSVGVVGCAPGPSGSDLGRSSLGSRADWILAACR